MKKLEKLAREICWREFSPPRSKKRLGHTRAEYWAKVSNEKRLEYFRDASFLVWCMKNMPVEMLASDYLNDK